MMDFIVGLLYWALVLGAIGSGLMLAVFAAALTAWVFMKIRNYIRSK